MSRQKAVCKVAARVPDELRALRAKLMIEPLCEALGVEETTCPACRGRGWLEERTLLRCPLCLGFSEVPERLADWFRDRMRTRRPRARPRRRQPPGGGALDPADRRPPEPGERAVSERWGRLAEEPHRLHLPMHH